MDEAGEVNGQVTDERMETDVGNGLLRKTDERTETDIRNPASQRSRVFVYLL